MPVQTMQGNKKYTDGLSDSSSIGSVLDDADREVSNLTDRAFRSLCISEDTSFNDSNLVISPDFAQQFFGSFQQGTVSHAIKKSNLCNRIQAHGSEHAGWASTFQQLPKYVQGEEKYPKSNTPPPVTTRRKLEIPVSGMRSSKPISKVSSLIKSFDRTENPSSDSLTPTSKQCALKTPLKCAPLPGIGVNFCMDSAFLTVRKVPAEISNTYQNTNWPGGRQGTPNAPSTNELTSNADGFHSVPVDTSKTFESNIPLPPTKPAKGKTGKANERASKGNFLHSENSAFESWNAHHKKLLERKEADEIIPEIKVPPNYEENILPLRELHPSRHEISPSHTRVHMNPEEKALLTTVPSASLSQVSNAQLASQSQSFVMEEKAPSSESKVQAETSQAPWRRSKVSKGGKERIHEPSIEKKTNGKEPSLHKRSDPTGQFPENDVTEEPLNSNECYDHDPPFNISKLLTPVIPTKHVLESLENESELATLPPPEKSMGSSEHEGRGRNEYQSRDSYKSKVPSLLFNLKDVRKRVKSTYSPSPLLKSLDEKTKVRDHVKQENISNGTFMSNGSEESPPNMSTKDKPHHQPYVGTKEKDHKEDINGDFTDNYMSLSSPQTIEEASFYVNGETSEQNDFKNDGLVIKDPRISDTDSQRYHHQSNEHSLRKTQPHLSLKLCNRDLIDGKVEENLSIHQLKNGLSRSISQETDHERDAVSSNTHFSQKISPGPLSPEEEDVFYSDTQSDFIPNLKSKAKISTSSSDQSFASFEDQQKTWFTECQREDRKSGMNLEESQKSEKMEKGLRKDDLQYYALSNGFVSVESSNKEEMSQREGESMSRDRGMIESKEEANCKDVWLGENKNTFLPDPKDPPLSPSPNSNKQIMFTIKDNTFKSSPVIRPIILPLLRTPSSENTHSKSQREVAEHAENTHLHQLESKDISTAHKTGQLSTSSSQTPSPYNKTHRSMSDSGQVFGFMKTENFQPISEATLLKHDSTSPFFPLIKENNGKHTQNLLNKVVGSDLENDSKNKEKPVTIKIKPTIILPNEDSGDQPPTSQLGVHSEEKTQYSKNHLFSTPREGSLVKNIVPIETMNSPITSSTMDSSVYSPAASTILDDAPQDPFDSGTLQGNLPNSAITSPLPSTCSNINSLASERKSSAKTARDDITHAMVPSTGHPQSDSYAEETLALPTRDTLLEETRSWTAPYERPQSAVHMEKSMNKPPAVPPKTEKALRRAKKLANKRKKMDLQQEKLSEIQEESPQMEGADVTWKRPLSPIEIPRSNFPRVRSLPPPTHRHSVATLSESVRRRPSGAQSVTPMSYPATQKKVLQDPHSGEYFVFDLPLQVRVKTFYDPETGKYVKVSIPSSERGSPETPSSEILNSPYLVYPGLHPLPVTSLTPLRSSSQLSAPTFLRQEPQSRESVDHWLQSFRDAKPPSSQSYNEPIHNSPNHRPGEVLQSSEKDMSEAQNLDIISIDDLEDFASEGIS